MTDFASELDKHLHAALQPIFKEEEDARLASYKKRERSDQSSDDGKASPTSALFVGICIGIVLTGMSSMRRE